ncbi:MAG: hypothetical protein JNG90_11380 [Planctomycetaceae bacterium]|nr:hypothetical protein [Planctomycetaceae bacterium]
MATMNDPTLHTSAKPGSSSRARHTVILFMLGLCAMAIANLVPLGVTWRAYSVDGYETVGWPFSFYYRGGFRYEEIFLLEKLIADLAIALSAAFLFARFFQNGWRYRLHQIHDSGLHEPRSRVL